VPDAYLVDVQRELMPAFLEAQYQYLADPANAETPTLLVGADCVLSGDPKCFQCGGDVVVTVDDRFTDCRINMGAVYVPKPGLVAGIWADALARCGDEWGDDQRAFRDALEASGVFVVELPCDLYNLAPDEPSQDCRHAAVLHFRGPRKRWMIDYCHKWLGLGEGTVLKVAPNTTEEQMMEHVRLNVARRLPEVPWTEEHEGHAVLVGGGASAAGMLDELRLRKSLGQKFFGLNGAVRWLIENGITPDYGVILDPRRENMSFLCEFDGDWLLASQCHPELVEACAAPTLWHFGSKDSEIYSILPESTVLVGGGLTVGLTAMGLAYYMGYRKIHLYGYDSSDSDSGAGHAYEQSENRAESRRCEAWIDGKAFFCSPGMYAQAAEFPKWAETLADAGAIITVHGDGLLPTVARCMQRAALATEMV